MSGCELQSIRNGKEIWSFNYEKIHWQINCLYRSFCDHALCEQQYLQSGK